MVKLQFSGKAYLKTEYLLYISRVISVYSEAEVLVISDNDCFHNEHKKYEVTKNVDIFYLSETESIEAVIHQFDYASYGYLVIDLEKSNNPVEVNRKIAVTNPYKQHVISCIKESEGIETVMVLNLESESKLNQRYFDKYLGKHGFKVMGLLIDSKDRETMLSNSYNGSFALARFSKPFKETLVKHCSVLMEQDVMDVQKKMKNLWRRLK